MTAFNLLKRLLDANAAVESAHDPELYEGERLEQIKAIQKAESEWMAARHAAQEFVDSKTKTNTKRHIAEQFKFKNL